MDDRQKYLGLRSLALAHKPEALGLAANADATWVSGAAIEQNVGGLTFLISAFASDDASLFTDAGFGVIGGASHKAVRVAARALVEQARQLASLFDE